MNKAAIVLFFLLVFCLPAPASGPQGTGVESVLTLQEAVRLALARGPEIFLAQAEAARAVEALREARSANLPQIMAGTGLAYNNGFPLSIEGAAPSIIQLGLSQSIFSQRNKNLVLEAAQGSLASQAGVDDVRNRLVARTLLLYNEVHEARQTVPILEELRETAVHNLQILEALLQAGKARSLDLTLAKVAAAGLDQQLLVSRERVRIAETSLRELTGMPDGSLFRTETPELKSELLTWSADRLYQKALESHPEIHEAQASLQAKELHIEAEKAERYPQFNIVSEYALFSRANNYQDYFNKFTRNNYLLGLSIQVPLFSGFRIDARVAQSRRVAEAARQRLLRLKSDLKLNVDRGVSDLRIAGGAVELARLEVAASKEKLQVSETLKEAGRIEPKELESVRAQVLEKQTAAIEAERVLFERQVMLLQASGSLITLF
jgi:outer membrane protein